MQNLVMTQSLRSIYCIGLTAVLLLGQIAVSKADQLADATRAFDAGDYSRAATLYKPLADNGNGIAQYHMGRLYSQGLVLQPDYPTALQWYMRAAEANNADAQRELGLLYSSGRGVQQNYKQAVRWFRSAAEQDDANAQFYLGRMCAEGTGVPSDYKLAEYWYRKSASQGNAAAQYELAECYLNGRCGKRDEEGALTWLELAAGNAVDSASRAKYVQQRDKIAGQIASRERAPSDLAEKIPSEVSQQVETDHSGNELVLSKAEPESTGSTEDELTTSLPEEHNGGAVDETEVRDNIETELGQAGSPTDTTGDEPDSENIQTQESLPEAEAVDNSTSEPESDSEIDATGDKPDAQESLPKKGFFDIESDHNSTSESVSDSDTVKDVL